MGGLRFKEDPDGPFLSDDCDAAIPPWARLRTLEEAARNYENDESGLTEKWLEQLIRPGSSLGGARPKATVIDEKGNLWIAKFPSKHDKNDSGAWEKVVHDMAKLCGIKRYGFIFNVMESVAWFLRSFKSGMQIDICGCV